MGIDVDVDIEYTVVVNQEEQYSIWPSIKSVPKGWVLGGFSGSKKECLTYIKEVWKDMRPLSLREDLVKRQEEIDSLVKAAKDLPAESLEDSALVQFLIDGEKKIKLHPNEYKNNSIEQIFRSGLFHLEISLGDYRTYLRIRCNPHDDLQPSNQSQFIHFSGFLEVDFTPLECQGSIDANTGDGFCSFIKSKEKK